MVLGSWKLYHHASIPLALLLPHLLFPWKEWSDAWSDAWVDHSIAHLPNP